jgi:hypothetical protein
VVTICNRETVKHERLRRTWGEKTWKVFEGVHTRSAKPGFIIYGIFRSKEIKPFGCIYVLIQSIFYKDRIYSLPIYFFRFHCREEKKKSETQKWSKIITAEERKGPRERDKELKKL